MALTTVPVELANLDGAVTINSSGADANFIVASDDNTHMLFVDAGNNRIGINDSAPQQLVDIFDSTLPVIRLTNGRNEGVASDYDLGKIEFFSNDSSGTGARVLTEINAIADANSTAPGGIFVIKTAPTNSATTERFRIDSSGYVSMPAQPAFQVRKSSSQDSLPTSTQTITFDTEIFDQNGDFASNTFTAPVTGKYQFNVHIRLENLDSAASFYQMKVLTSNRTYIFTLDPNGFQSTDLDYYSFAWSALADMDASDTAYLTIIQSGGTSQTDIHTESYFSGYLVA